MLPSSGGVYSPVMRELAWILGTAAWLFGCSSESSPEPQPEPAEPIAPQTLLPSSCGHAHNDYEHAQPLLDAVALGFCSIEVDIFLEGEELLVGHTLASLDPSRTIQSLYLDPMRALHEAGDLPTPTGGASLILLIDIKSSSQETYAALDPILASYDDVFTRFEDGQVFAGPVTALISGNRDRDGMEAQALRFAALDGRPGDLGTGAPLDLIPLVSSSWGSFFSWSGTGEMPADERMVLDDTVASAHAEDRRFRFWASPDTVPTWQTLLDAEADLVNTDDLQGLSSFLAAP